LRLCLVGAMGGGTGHTGEEADAALRVPLPAPAGWALTTRNRAMRSRRGAQSFADTLQHAPQRVSTGATRPRLMNGEDALQGREASCQ